MCSAENGRLVVVVSDATFCNFELLCNKSLEALIQDYTTQLYTFTPKPQAHQLNQERGEIISLIVRLSSRNYIAICSIMGLRPELS